MTPTVLSIAGFDPSGGAGVLVDTKTVHALGGYAYGVVTAQTVQTPCGVTRVVSSDVSLMHDQLSALFECVCIDAVKIGMLGDAATVETVAQLLKRCQTRFIVLDTVLLSTSGASLLTPQGQEAMVTQLFPLATLITPNVDEVNALLGSRYEGRAEEVAAMAEGLFSLGARNVLIKGGHSQERDAVDYLVQGSDTTRFSHPRIATTRTHGTGCVLSSAIATGLAKGLTLAQSVKEAKDFVASRMQSDTPNVTVIGDPKACQAPLL